MPTHADLYGQGQTEGRFSSDAIKAVGSAQTFPPQRNNRQYTACDPAIGTIPCVQFLLRAGSLQKLHVISL